MNRRIILAIAAGALAAGPNLGFGQKVSSVKLSPASIRGGTSVSGVVTLASAGAATTVSLSSSDSSSATVPSSIVIPNGSLTGTFTASTIPVAATKSILVTASVNGTQKTAVLKISPPVVKQLTISPKSLVAGAGATGSIEINGPAPAGGITFTVTSDLAAAVVPGTVVVSAGSTSATFPISTAYVATDTTANITVSKDDVSATASLHIASPITVADIHFEPNRITGGNAASGVVTLTKAAPTGGVEISLASDNPYAAIPPKLTVAKGQSSLTFSATTFPIVGSTRANITADANGHGKTTSLDVVQAVPTTLTFNPVSILGGKVLEVTVGLNGPAPSGGEFCILSSTSSAIPAASIVVPQGKTTATVRVQSQPVQVMTSVILSVTGGGATLAVPLTVYAETLAASSWPKFRGDATNSGQTLGQGAAGIVAWSRVTGDGGGGMACGSAVFGPDGTAYVGNSDGYLSAYEPDGTRKWRTYFGAWTYTAPVVGKDGTIYCGTSTGRIYAIAPDSTKKWEFDTGGFINSSTSIGPDGTIYSGSAAGFFALTPDGTKRWSYPTGLTVGCAAFSPDGTIYVGSDDSYLYALTQDGALKWRFKTTGAIKASPAIGSDGTIYFGSQAGSFFAVKPDGTKRWEYKMGWVSSSAAIGPDKTIYVTCYTDGLLYAFNPKGTLKWSAAAGSHVDYSSPAIGGDGTIYVGTDSATLVAFRANGTLKWQCSLGEIIRSSPAIGSDGTVYVGDYNGTFYAIK